MKINKCLVLIKLHLENQFVYRLSFFIWRFRMFMLTIMNLTVWAVILNNNNEIGFDYSHYQMMSYILIFNFLQNILFSTQLTNLSEQIYSGELSNLMVKPMNILLYLSCGEIADKFKNTFYGMFDLIILSLIAKISLQTPTIINFFMLIVFLIIGLIMYFLIMMIISAIGFFSPETWAPKFLFRVMLRFFSGQMFPLDIMPVIFQKIVYLTPFAYIGFIQTQIYLGRINIYDQLDYLTYSLIVTCLLYLMFKKIWNVGIKNYSAHGR